MRASALLITLSVVAGLEATTGQATVTLVGTTLDSATLQPIPAVSVYTTTTVRTDFTDASGAFRLADLPQEHISSPCVEVAIGSLPGNAPSESPLRFLRRCSLCSVRRRPTNGGCCFRWGISHRLMKRRGRPWIGWIGTWGRLGGEILD